MGANYSHVRVEVGYDYPTKGVDKKFFSGMETGCVLT
jgi:hypothetical protein